MANIKGGRLPWFGKKYKVPSICSLPTESKIGIFANKKMVLTMFLSFLRVIVLSMEYYFAMR